MPIVEWNPHCPGTRNERYGCHPAEAFAALDAMSAQMVQTGVRVLAAGLLGICRLLRAKRRLRSCNSGSIRDAISILKPTATDVPVDERLRLPSGRRKSSSVTVPRGSRVTQARNRHAWSGSAESSGRPPSDVRNAHTANALTTTTTTRELSPYHAPKSFVRRPY